jgi:putative MFS transporter
VTHGGTAATTPGRPGRPAALVLGIGLVALGVGLHFLDFLEMREGMTSDHAAMGAEAVRAEGSSAGGSPGHMSMGPLGMIGMAIDGAGLALASWGLWPRGRRLWGTRGRGLPDAQVVAGSLAGMDDSPMTRSHWVLVTRLFVGIVLDTMKPATIGFMLPGLRAEYGLLASQAALLPLSALAGTTVGSVLFGRLGDVIGRRASFLLTALILAATSICGLMPAFSWQLVMCFIMGMAAGGELPLVYAMIAETMPARHRGWLAVVVGGVGSLLGLVAASTAALFIEPVLSWRGLFLMNLPTALGMFALMRWVPESPRFLLERGYVGEARTAMGHMRIGYSSDDPPAVAIPTRAGRIGPAALRQGPLARVTGVLCLYGLAWGLCNWGFITWLPTMLRDLGRDGDAATRTLVASSLLAAPGSLVAAWLYATWSSKRTAVAAAAGTAAALAALAAAEWMGAQGGDAMVAVIALLLLASSSMIGVLAPYSVELYPTDIRGVGSGVVAASSKIGGLLGPGMVGMLLTAVPGLALPALAVALPIGLAGAVLMHSAPETRGRRLEDLLDAGRWR